MKTTALAFIAVIIGNVRSVIGRRTQKDFKALTSQINKESLKDTGIHILFDERAIEWLYKKGKLI